MSIKNNTAASARLHTTHRIRRHTHRRSLANPVNDQMSTSSGAIRSVGDKQREQRHVKTETRSFVYNKSARIHTHETAPRAPPRRQERYDISQHTQQARSKRTWQQTSWGRAQSGEVVFNVSLSTAGVTTLEKGQPARIRLKNQFIIQSSNFKQSSQNLAGSDFFEIRPGGCCSKIGKYYRGCFHWFWRQFSRFGDFYGAGFHVAVVRLKNKGSASRPNPTLR